MGMLLFLVLTYLLASLPFGVIITTLYGDDRDIRGAGSGNIGATNVARVYGWRWAMPVVLLDMSKGFIPVLLGQLWWPDWGLIWGGAIIFTAFGGHCFSVFLDFRGGKGVATGAGAMLALAPLPAAFAILLWCLVLFTTGRSSLAALTGTMGIIVGTLALAPEWIPVVLILAVAVALTHTANISRLLRGQEREVVAPVRLTRGSSGELESAEVLLDQAPSGFHTDTVRWRSEEE